MRRNRLLVGGFAAAVTLGLLAVAQPANATPETDNQITADTDVVIFAIQSRAPNIGDLGGNALSICNTSASATVNLNLWTVLVEDGGAEDTASHTFGNINLLPGQRYVLHTTNFVVNPIDGQVPRAPFSGQDLQGANTDEIEVVYQVTLTSDTPTQIDRVASAGTASITPEGNEPAPQLTAATDQLNAFVRRDALCTDTDNNRDDFRIMPASW